MHKNTICLWFDKDAEEAARFYAATFPDSRVTAVHRAPADHPSGKAGDVLTVQFTVAGIPCLGLNGGPAYPHTAAFSFQIATAAASMRLPAPACPTIWHPSRRPVPRSATALTWIGPAPGA